MGDRGCGKGPELYLCSSLRTPGILEPKSNPWVASTVGKNHNYNSSCEFPFSVPSWCMFVCGGGAVFVGKEVQSCSEFVIFYGRFILKMGSSDF